MDDIEEGDLMRSQSFVIDEHGHEIGRDVISDDRQLGKAQTLPSGWVEKRGEFYSADSDSTPINRTESFTHTPIIRGNPISGVSHAKPKFQMITIEQLASPDSEEEDLK